MLYGDPIYVEENMDEETTEKIRLKVEQSLNNLYEDLKKNYKKYLKS